MHYNHYESYSSGLSYGNRIHAKTAVFVHPVYLTLNHVSGLFYPIQKDRMRYATAVFEHPAVYQQDVTAVHYTPDAEG